MQRRRHFERPTWNDQVEILKEKASAASCDKERAELLRRAGELEKAMQMERWLSNTELRKPS